MILNHLLYTAGLSVTYKLSSAFSFINFLSASYIIPSVYNRGRGGLIMYFNAGNALTQPGFSPSVCPFSKNIVSSFQSVKHQKPGKGEMLKYGDRKHLTGAILISVPIIVIRINLPVAD